MRQCIRPLGSRAREGPSRGARARLRGEGLEEGVSPQHPRGPPASCLMSSVAGGKQVRTLVLPNPELEAVAAQDTP